MSIKMTGAEFKAWLASDWKRTPADDPIWDDVLVLIDDIYTDDPVPDEISDTAVVVIESGVVIFNQNQHDSDTMIAVEHIKAWRKRQAPNVTMKGVDRALRAILGRRLAGYMDADQKTIVARTTALDHAARRCFIDLRPEDEHTVMIRQAHRNLEKLGRIVP